MRVHQAFRYELDPNNRQRTLLRKSAGTARFAYNWALADRIERFEKSEGRARFTSYVEQHRMLNRRKKTEFPWMYEVSKCCPQEALRDCERAFKNFWEGRKKGRKVGFPKFKKKGRDDAFRLTGAIRVVDARHVRLPRIGRVRTKERTTKLLGRIRAGKARILSATVRREADRWYVSLTVERERPDPIGRPEGAPVGIDFGIEAFITTSLGERFVSPKPLRRYLDLLRRRSRRHARKRKGSGNRRKSALRLAKLHRRIRNIRTDYLHKVTTRLAKTKAVVAVEDLTVRGMMRQGPLARAIADAGWRTARRMLEYKTGWYGSELRVIPRFAPTSRMCHRCGALRELGLGDRMYVCSSCGHTEHRDVNAAKNILMLGLMQGTGSSPGSDACGDPSGGGTVPLDRSTSRGSVKQEASAVWDPVRNG